MAEWRSLSKYDRSVRALSRPKHNFLPYGRQLIDDEDIAAVAEALRGDFLTTGPAIEQFEAALLEAVGGEFAIACSSGTAALHLAALALELAPGDAVVVPSLTFLATANAVRYVGGEVVFADIDPESGQMLPRHLEEALRRPGGEKSRAVFPVCLTGAISDPVALAAAAGDCRIVYDACHALGTTYRSDAGVVSVGNCQDADMATFSFHPVKTIALGEGGAVTTNNSALAERLRLMRNHGMTRAPDDFVNLEMAFDLNGDPNPWYYEMAEPGFNYRLTDIQCALGLSQIGKLDVFSARRRTLAAKYRDCLQPIAPYVRPLETPDGCDPVLHLFSVLIDFAALDIPRSKVMNELRKMGIGTQVHYIPVHKQPYYRQRYGDITLPGVDAYYDRTLSLPLFAGMSDDDIDRVVQALAEVLQLQTKL